MNFKEILADVPWAEHIATAIRIVLILVIALIAVKLMNMFITKLGKRLARKSHKEGEPPSESEKRIHTLIRLIRHFVLALLWLTVGLIVLKEFRVEITPILASLGVVGLALGFGAQNLVRDILAGFFMILENQVRVGDVAVVNGTGGLVEKINFRTIVLRDLSGTVHIFTNGTVNTLSNMTNEWSAYVFEIGVAYKENTDLVIEIMKKVGEGMKEDPEFGPLMIEPLEINGVDKFADSAVIIKGRIKTKPIRQWAVGRQFLRRVKIAFDEHGIEIPFPHRTIYFGEESKPFNLQLIEKYKEKQQ